jgi:alkanesulfonate monooxygenase SsuD/methylene tetrahydromethanopterin reductase-like flavin-dependent oxidoreductase (luciferase family)
MRFGLFFAFQVVPGTGVPLDEPYRDMLDCLPRAEELGYESVFVASHHV